MRLAKRLESVMVIGVKRGSKFVLKVLVCTPDPLSSWEKPASLCAVFAFGR
jgi:hypothetical protein